METTVFDLAHLRTEGERLHTSIFGYPIPEPVLQKYVEAHNFYLRSPEKSELIWMSKVIRSGFDLEALEIALRFSNRDHLLVRKAKILIYVTETFDAYRPLLINERPQRLRAMIALTFHGLRTALKFIKGKFLLWRLNRLV